MNIKIIFAGLGGQGILFVSKLFSEFALKQGWGVIGSETHGMSQRGGSVTAHLKIGDYFSPLIKEHSADLLFCFEHSEIYRSILFVKPGGIVFVNLDDGSVLEDNLEEYLQMQKIKLRHFGATCKAMEIGSILMSNILLIGFAIGTGLFAFDEQTLKEALKLGVREKYREINMKAIDLGINAGRNLELHKRKAIVEDLSEKCA